MQIYLGNLKSDLKRNDGLSCRGGRELALETRQSISSETHRSMLLSRPERRPELFELRHSHVLPPPVSFLRGPVHRELLRK